MEFKCNAKEEGNIHIIAWCMMFLFVFIMFMLYIVRINEINTAKSDILSNIDVANHAALLPDKGVADASATELSLVGVDASNCTMYVQPEVFPARYRAALQRNFSYLADYNDKNEIITNLKLAELYLYNVTARLESGRVVKDIDWYRYDALGNLKEHIHYDNGVALGNVITPNGHIVTDTAVYSKVNFEVETFYGQKVSASLDCTSLIHRDTPGTHNNK